MGKHSLPWIFLKTCLMMNGGVHEMMVKLDPPMVNFSSSSGESSDSED